MENKDQITYFADTDARNRRVRFGIKAGDRTRHVYVIGKTGMGKSTLLENMAAQDIRNGNGFAFIDPHGKTAELLLEYIPEERIKDVLYFAPFDMEYPISFNVMEDVGYDKRHLVVSGLMSTFKKIWVDAWSARMEYILGNTLLALLEYPEATLLDVNRMLSDKNFRNKVVENIKDPSVKSFWTNEFAKYTDRFAAEATPAIQNKIGQFTSNPLIRNIVGQPNSTFDLRKIMDEKKILIINLSKGRVGEQNANLLGSMLITKIYLAALSRADIPDRELEKLPNFYLYVDEFQSFANESFANILSEARKYKLNLTIAHQYIEQMTDEVRAAVFGNVGTLITFRVGSYDAEVLEKEFAPTLVAQDIVNLGAYQIYLRLMINGISSHPFSARSIPPLEKPEKSYVDEIIKTSRETYAHPREQVEELIKKNLSVADERKEIAAAKPRSSGERNSSERGPGERNTGERSFTLGENRGLDAARDGKHNRDSKQNNNFRPRQNRVIDEKTKVELEKALNQKPQAPPVETGLSLSEIPKNPRDSSSQENKNALREALSAVLKKEPAVAKTEDKIKTEDKVKTEVKIKIEDKKSEASEKKPANQERNNLSGAPSDKSETQRAQKAFHEQREVPKKELKRILGIE